MIVLALLYWRYVVIGLLVVALGIQTVRLNWLEASVAKEHAAQLAEIARVQAEADEWSNRLIAKQAETSAVRTMVVTQYVDRIRNVASPDTSCASDERMRLGSRGVSDIILGKTKAK